MLDYIECSFFIRVFFRISCTPRGPSAKFLVENGLYFDIHILASNDLWCLYCFACFTLSAVAIIYWLKYEKSTLGLLSGLCRILPRFRSSYWISIHSSMHVTWMLWLYVGSGVERKTYSVSCLDVMATKLNIKLNKLGSVLSLSLDSGLSAVLKFLKF